MEELHDFSPRIHECWLERVRVPDGEVLDPRPLYRLVLRGDYFHVGATGVEVFVGRIRAVPDATDGTTLVAYLYDEPREGSEIIARQGDQVMVAPERFSRALLRTGEA